MAVKYTIPFYDDANVLWRADIDLPAYSGAPIEITGVGRTFASLDYGASNEDLFEPIVGSTLTLQFYSRSQGEVDVRELQLLQDLQGRVRLYRAGALYWSGYILPDGIVRNMTPPPVVITLTASDGLMLLNDVPFTAMGYWSMPPGIAVNSPLGYVRSVLGATAHLNNPLPIRWVNYVGSARYCDDAFAGQTPWASNRTPWYPDVTNNPSGENRSCLWVLRGMLEMFQMRIYQVAGKWEIERVNDIASGTYFWKEITEPRGASVPILTSGLEENKQQEPFFINENYSMTIQPALTNTEVTYDYTARENKLPNGGFDETLLSQVLDWNVTGAATMSTRLNESLDGRPGNSVEVGNPSESSEGTFRLTGSLPVDTHILNKSFSLGFQVQPLNGFPFYTSGPDQGKIVWEDKPLQLSVQLVRLFMAPLLPDILYLNEFGFWQPLPMTPVLSASIQNNDTQQVYISFSGRPQAGSTVGVDVRVNESGGLTYSSAHLITQSENDNMANFLAGINATINQSLPPAITSFVDTGNRIRIVHAAGFRLVVTAQPSDPFNGLTPDGYISAEVAQAKIGDVGSIVFRGRGGSDLIPFPDLGPEFDLPHFTSSRIDIAFKVQPGQRYVLDNAYFHFDDTQSVWTSELPMVDKKTNKYAKSLTASSSAVGFHYSNMMNTYSSAREDSVYYDMKHASTLTGITANAIMRMRHEAREVFTGDFYTAGVRFGNVNLFSLQYYEDNYGAGSTPQLHRVVLTLKPNTEYTLTTDVPSRGGTAFDVFFHLPGQSSSSAVNGVGAPEMPSRTIVSNSNGEVAVAIRFTGLGGTAEADILSGIRHIMLVQGDTAVPWTPAPEDIGPWRFNNIYNIEGKNFLPLNSRYNIETCTVNVMLFEAKDGDPALIEKHNGMDPGTPDVSCDYPPVGTWVGVNPSCMLDADGFNTGTYGFTQLYNAALDLYKDNAPSDPNYIAPTTSDQCDAAVLVSSLAKISNDAPYTLAIYGNGQKYRVRIIRDLGGGTTQVGDTYEGTDITHTYDWFNEAFFGVKDIEYFGGRKNVTRIEFNGSNLSAINLTGFTNINHLQLGWTTTPSVITTAINFLNGTGVQNGYLSYGGTPDSGALSGYNSLISKGWTIDGAPPA